MTDEVRDILVDEDDVKELENEIAEIQDRMNINPERFAIMLAIVSKSICDAVHIEVEAVEKPKTHRDRMA